jgi:hypothetical protein
MLALDRLSVNLFFAVGAQSGLYRVLIHLIHPYHARNNILKLISKQDLMLMQSYIKFR